MYIYVYLFVVMYVYVYICACTHTRIHIRIFWWPDLRLQHEDGLLVLTIKSQHRHSLRIPWEPYIVTKEPYVESDQP